MEVIKNLITRLRSSGILLLVGFLLIIYIAFVFLYWQQGSQQRELEVQITKLSLVVAKPLPSDEKLRAEYDEVNLSLAPMTVKAALKILVGIASDSGIDVDPDGGKLRIPPAIIRVEKVGDGNYQVLSFRNISVQADYEVVVAFISKLDSDKTLKTMALRRVDTSPITVMFIGEEGVRRAEFRNVASAVIDMMTDNDLLKILNPMKFAGGVATNLMGDDPDTAATGEGFPDIITTAAQKGYSGNVTPRKGYVLYSHDKILADNTTQFVTVSYITVLTTQYYYTCEADGTVRQFDGADVVTATEYLGSEESKIETVVTVDVDIYIKPEE